jgi:HPt (histidine-containing phosphotransfer) domain-containing protein
MDETPAQPVNVETLRTLREMAGDAGFDEIRAEFLSSTAEMIVSLRRDAADGDCEALRRKAHNMRGASGSLGAERLAALCRELELELDRPSAPGGKRGAQLVERIAAEFSAARAALERA